MKRWKGLTAVLIISAIALISVVVLFSISNAKTEQNGKDWQRIQWVDEKGVVHTTILSPRPKTPDGQNPPAARQPMPTILSAKVVKVLSGDTIMLEGDKKLRYVGLKAPEKGENGYKEAIEYHTKLVEGKFVNVLFDQNPNEPDGTLLGFVFINRMTFVNAELIRNGYAKAYPQHPNVKYEVLFNNLQERAKNRKLGIWKD